ncbi:MULTISPECIES: N-acetyltransferase [unclassified Spirosoma]|uniref:GNAT family N-acetyltransferase n=1 Tax=unclassified Spirosoma TaxID=2621999 RepID=UPI000969379C|nr:MULTISPECIES: N-acetyltransferase [unclassified Spirosoma]MBN8821156.1 GNAT family N-acetyltransferase [Spirosoma sp.]OJW79212.1 MAG: GNAT family N-acetyltransferase [Spirosoma sp. 48-14]
MVRIRKATPIDKEAILQLHREVARISQGIARTEPEITETYIETLFQTTDQHGLMLVTINDSGAVIAEIHASKYGLRIFDHILTGLTIAVHPTYQGKGVGKKLFEAFLDNVQHEFPEVSRVELESRASNQKSIGLYQNLGFVLEGRMKHKTRNQDGSYEDSLLMAWTKPGFVP